eukprot:1162150-Pelagomonas_calceolata.AAC.13
MKHWHIEDHGIRWWQVAGHGILHSLFIKGKGGCVVEKGSMQQLIMHMRPSEALVLRILMPVDEAHLCEGSMPNTPVWGPQLTLLSKARAHYCAPLGPHRCVGCRSGDWQCLQAAHQNDSHEVPSSAPIRAHQCAPLRFTVVPP